MRAFAAALVLALPLQGCSRGPEEPDAAVAAMLAEARELLDEADGWELQPAGPDAAALRRRLREHFADRVVLPLGLTWRHPLVDAATAEALAFLQRLEPSAEVRLETVAPEARPPRATVTVRTGAGPGAREARLRLERRGGTWRLCEPWRRPRPAR